MQGINLDLWTDRHNDRHLHEKSKRRLSLQHLFRSNIQSMKIFRKHTKYTYLENMQAYQVHKSTCIQEIKSTCIQVHKCTCTPATNLTSWCTMRNCPVVPWPPASYRPTPPSHTSAPASTQQSTKVQKHKSAKVQKYKSTKVQKYKSTKVQKHKSTKVQMHKSTKIDLYIKELAVPYTTISTMTVI